MDINVTHLDEGYNQCANLNNFASTKGEKLISDLESTITNLKLHWVASDATVHINNLINVHDALVALITDAKADTADAAERIIAIQTIRSANGGGGLVGDPLSSSAPKSNVLVKCDDTSAYNVDPSAKDDYFMLQEECTSFSSFVSEFTQMKDELFNNWQQGANRETAVSNFSKFADNADTYNTYLTSARDNLGIAVSNLSQL